ncbi:MAG: hypothetical protein LBU56_04905, partial [Rickettsiales bacterium]|nr:hypothetical protein [Rickettsiales bacterium]
MKKKTLLHNRFLAYQASFDICKKLLDNLRQSLYHGAGGVQLSSSVQIKRQEYYVVGVLCL